MTAYGCLCSVSTYFFTPSISLKHIACLQRIQHAAAREVGLSCTSILVHLQCLQVNFSNNSIGFLLNGVHGLNLPRCHLDLQSFTHWSPTIPFWPLATLRTHEVSALTQFSSAFSPRHNLTFGSGAFRFSAPRVWTSLPVSIREYQSLPTFRRHLKTFYFQSAYPPLSCPSYLEYLNHPRALILQRPVALYKSCTYSLTYLLTVHAG